MDADGEPVDGHVDDLDVVDVVVEEEAVAGARVRTQIEIDEAIALLVLGVTAVLEGEPVRPVGSAQQRAPLVPGAPARSVVAHDAPRVRPAGAVDPTGPGADRPGPAAAEADPVARGERAEGRARLLVALPGIAHGAGAGVVACDAVGIGPRPAIADVPIGRLDGSPQHHRQQTHGADQSQHGRPPHGNLVQNHAATALGRRR